MCFEVCALCLSSTMECSKLYMWQIWWNVDDIQWPVVLLDETRNEEGGNVPCQSVLGLFGFRKMSYTPRRREYKEKK